MKKKTLSTILGVTLIFGSLIAQTYPLSENSWDNPEFVDRFLGSYGVLTEKEPEITTEESELFQSIGEMLDANNMQGAINALRTSITPESSAALDYTLGNLYLQSSDYASGVRAYEAAIRKFPNFLRAYKNSGLAYIQMQNYEKAAEFITKSIELGSQEGDNFGLLGYCYLNLGLNDAALDAYRFAALLSPKNKDWQVGKATALQRVGLYEEAIAKFDELIQKNPNTKAYYTAAANASISLQEQLKAAKYLEVLRRRNLADTPVLMLLGDIYLNQKLIPLATDTYLLVVDQATSKDSERILRFARALVSTGAYEQAIEFIDAIENNNRTLSQANRQPLLNLRSQVALATGAAEEAVATLEELIKEDPLNGEALILLGEFYYDSGDYETATFYFERAQKISKYAVEAFVQTARVKVAQSQFVEALNLLQQAQALKYQSHIEDYMNAIRNALKASA